MNSKVCLLSLICLFGLDTASQSENAALPVTSKVSATAQDFCEAFADKAAEAKLARQRRELLDVKIGIEQQLATLEEKTRLLQALITKRNEIRESVSTSLVKMYANVDSEIAAQQLQKLNPQAVSEVLQRLSPKQSGEIVTAMEVEFASKVVKTMMADAARQKLKAETQ